MKTFDELSQFDREHAIMFFLADIVAVLNDPQAPSAIRSMVDTALNAQSSDFVSSKPRDPESLSHAMVGAARMLAEDACYLDSGEKAIGDGRYYLTGDGKRAIYLEDLELFGQRAQLVVKKGNPVQ